VRYAYLALIRPIELLLGWLFESFFRASGDYGLSLLLLSCSVTLLTAPLYYLAERWKREEEEVARLMRRDLECVRRNYTGQKRFYLTRNVHRLFGYRPELQLKASFGLIVQIPFFLAAYGLLSRHEGLRGRSFLFLQDLGRPDGLLPGGNLLPLVMTAVNLASALAYTRSLSIRKNLAMLLMALAFLVLLYDRPSALLLYWSMNNLLSLGKNLFFPARRAAEPEEAEPEPGPLSWLRGLFGGSLRRPALLLAALCAVAAQCWWLTFRLASFEYCLAAAAALAGALSLAAAIRAFAGEGWRRGAASLVPLLAAWAPFAASAWVLVFDRKQNAFVSNRNIKLLATLLADAAAMAAAARLGPRAPGRGGSRTPGAGLYLSGLGFAGLWLFALAPLRVYFSSPADMGVSALELLGGNLPALAIFLLAGSLPVLAELAARRLLPSGRARPATEPAELLLAALLLAGAAFSLASSSAYGVLSDFSLEKAFLLEKPPLWQYAADVAILFASFVVARWALRERRGAAAACLAIMAAASVAQVLAASARVEPGELASVASPAARAEGELLPGDAAELHRFSRRGRNVVFVIADMFNGNYLGRAVEERPELAERLDGFTWRPNALAAGSVTAISLPSIYGGPAFEPERLGSLPGTGRDKLQLAAGLFFGRLQEAGFSVTATDALYADYASLSRGGKLRLAASERYVGAWKAREGMAAEAMEGSKNALLTMLGLFGAAPYMLKPRIYDEGSWILFRRSYQFGYIARKTARNFAYLDLLPELSSSSEEAPPLALFIHTQFTHEPYGIDAAGEIIRDEYPDPATRSFVDGRSAYLTARAFVDAFLRWTDWMKREGIYDRTMIVLLSDHGNGSQDNGIAAGPGLDNPIDRHALSRARALLMYKPFGARGRLREDGRLAGSSDAGTILFAGLGLGAPPPEPSSEGRTFSVISGDWADFLAGERAEYSAYRLRGAMDDPSAWSRE